MNINEECLLSFLYSPNEINDILNLLNDEKALKFDLSNVIDMPIWQAKQA